MYSFVSVYIGSCIAREELWSEERTFPPLSLYFSKEVELVVNRSQRSVFKALKSVSQSMLLVSCSFIIETFHTEYKQK